ncbi:hypothetical protein B566_EDAN007812 [Ephemera danica]|nr:hypothetical protein B566_EDAN007812 [Ephemera danica]
MSRVADLKKELKTRGLSTTGNKQELTERLQNWLDTSGDVSLTIEDADVDESLPGEEDEDLSNDSPILMLDNQNSLTNEPVATSKAADPTPAEQAKSTTKKIVLNRTNLPALEKENVSEKETKVGEEDTKTVNIAQVPLTAKERLELRAKKFGLPTTDSDAKESKAEPGKIAAAKITSEVAPPLDVLKKRAERFGTSVSSLVQTAEIEEKKRQRAERFGVSGESKISLTKVSSTTAAPTPAIAAKRARITAPSGTTPVTGTTDDKKRQRAERFKMTT